MTKGIDKAPRIIFFVKEMSFLSIKTYTKYNERTKNKDIKISSKDQRKATFPPSLVVHKIKSKTKYREKTKEMLNNILLSNDLLSLRKTKNPKSNEIIITGICE